MGYNLMNKEFGDKEREAYEGINLNNKFHSEI